MPTATSQQSTVTIGLGIVLIGAIALQVQKFSRIETLVGTMGDDIYEMKMTMRELAPKEGLSMMIDAAVIRANQTVFGEIARVSQELDRVRNMPMDDRWTGSDMLWLMNEIKRRNPDMDIPTGNEIRPEK